MDCRDFEAWLDAGRPVATRASADAHAAGCPSCTVLAIADAELDVALETRLSSSAPDFTERVLARVAADRTTAALPIDPELLLPWWAQVLREPAALVGLALGAVSTMSGPLLVPAARSAVPVLLRAVTGVSGYVDGLTFSPLLLVPLVAPLLAGAVWALYRLANAAATRLSGASP